MKQMVGGYGNKHITYIVWWFSVLVFGLGLGLGFDLTARALQ